MGVRTAYVTSYEAAVEFLEKQEVSLLLLDINLGDRSGFDLCRKVRDNYDMPIFFISARTSDDDILIALNIGGDDVAGNTITADRPENAVIYVYNKYHEVVYSTHMRNADGNIPLPSGGYIMFAGLDGESVLINH